MKSIQAFVRLYIGILLSVAAAVAWIGASVRSGQGYEIAIPDLLVVYGMIVVWLAGPLLVLVMIATFIFMRVD